MQYAYLVLFIISLLLLPIYFISISKRKDEHWLFILLICVSIVNLGYLLISISRTVDFALFSNKIVYLGQVFIPLCMFMIISKLCGYKFNKIVVSMLFCFALIMLSIVCTTGYLNWYYTKVSIEIISGVTILQKEYGILHPVNLIYVIIYFISMIVITIYSIIKNKAKNQKHALIMLIIVLGNIMMWIIQKIIPWNFELLSVTYLMSASAFLGISLMLQDYVHVKDIPLYSPKQKEKLGVDILTMSLEDKIKKVLYFVKEGEILITREREILELILANKKRKEIAAELFLSENTVKTYIRTLYSKLGVSSREELYALLIQNNNY